MIYTFYSYKGGVGRSMALVNIAELMCRARLKVLMVDWDLEAPGLEWFFPTQLKRVQESPGVVDMLLAYKQKALRFNPDSEELLYPVDDLQTYVTDLHDPISSKPLWLLPAGRRSGPQFATYANRVMTFDWQDLYENWEGEIYFEWLRGELEKFADVVLIDSRTGVTEMGGVCTYQLADVVVMFCAANVQSINGTLRMVESFHSPQFQEIRGDRELRTLIVPARIERIAEIETLNDFRRKILDYFSDYMPPELQEESELFIKLEIPYVPLYAFEEIIAVNRTKTSQRSVEMEDAYESLYQALSRLAPEDSAVRASFHRLTKRSDIEGPTRETAVSTAEFRIRNPYIHRSAIKDPRGFFGRIQETHELLHHTVAGESVSVVGPRRIGKTSLLLHLRRSTPAVEADSETRHLYVFLDCQRKYEADQFNIYQWMWSETLKEAERIEEQLSVVIEPAINDLPDTIQSTEDFEEALGELCAAGFELTLLLDEFDMMALNPQLDIGFFSHLRSLAVDYPVSYVTSSSKPLLDLEYSDRSILRSPFFNIFHQQRLGFLAQEEAQSLILEQVRGIEAFPAHTQQELDFLFEVAGYHPAFLGVACYYLFEHKVAGEEWSDRTAEEIRQEYRDEVVSHFRYAWEQLTSDQKKAMVLICIGQADEVSRQLWTQLHHQCLVYGRKPFSSVFRGFVLQEGTAGAVREVAKLSLASSVLDLFIGLLALLTIVSLVLTVLFRAPGWQYISVISLFIAVVLSLVRSFIK